MSFMTIVALGVGLATFLVGSVELFFSELRLREARRTLAEARRTATKPPMKWETHAPTYRTALMPEPAHAAAHETMWRSLVRWVVADPKRSMLIDIAGHGSYVTVLDEFGFKHHDDGPGGLGAQIERVVIRAVLKGRVP